MKINKNDILYVFPNGGKYIKFKVKFLTKSGEIMTTSNKIIKLSQEKLFYNIYYRNNKNQFYFHIVLKNKWLFPIAKMLEIINFKFKQWFKVKN